MTKLIAFVLLASSSAFAKDLPNCWDAKDKLEPKNYIISIDVKKLKTAEDLLSALALAGVSRNYPENPERAEHFGVLYHLQNLDWSKHKPSETCAPCGKHILEVSIHADRTKIILGDFERFESSDPARKTVEEQLQQLLKKDYVTDIRCDINNTILH